MTDSPNLALPYIDGGEAQPFVTYNDAVRALDALVQLAVLDRDLASPPGSPSDGQRWIVAASPSGAWAGHATQIAAWQDGAWEFYAPRTGWFAYVPDEGTLLAWNGTAWVDAMAILTVFQNLALLGVGTTADSTNPFSAKLNNALWVAKTVSEGGDGNLRYKLSKESAADTLSFLFQDNYSGRAEIGLTGDDDFHFKVSADGSTWSEAIVVDRTTGGIRFRAAETSVASASTCDIGAAASLKVAITGTTTITSFGTAPHALRFVKFAGALTLTHNATTLVLPGAANIAVAANDRAIAVSDASGNWYVVAYQRANGKAVIGPAAADVTDGTSVGRALLTAADAPTARAAIYAAPIDALAANGMQVNGGMEASQENGTGAVTLTATGSLQTKYLLDGVMAAYRGSFVATAQQVTSPFVGGRYALKFTVGTAEASLGANDELSVFIPFEGVRVGRLALGTANAASQSLGFWCQAHRTGTYSGSIRNAGKTRSYPFTFTIGAADTPTWVSLSGVNAIPGDTTGTWAIDTSVGMYVSICLAGGSSRVGIANAWAGSDYSGATGTTNGVAATSDVFTIGSLIAVPGIELPVSDRAAFIMRPIDQELLLCKRYYVSLGGESTAQKFVSGICLFSTGFLGPVTLQTDMRAQPSVSYSNLSDFQIVYSGGSTTTPTAIAMDWNSVRVPTLSITTASVLTAGQAGLLQSASTSARLKFDSRL